MATIEQKRVLLLTLTSIGANGPESVKSGICSNVRRRAYHQVSDIWDVLGYMDAIIARWPEATCPVYPIEGKAGYVTSEAVDNRWNINHPIGQKRYRLLAFLIHELTKELHDADQRQTQGA